MQAGFQLCKINEKKPEKMKTNITLSKNLMINNKEIFEYSVDLSNEVNIILQ